MTSPTKCTIGSLFSGIGGLELGLERAGLGPVVWQCELDPFCRRVLAKHWPDVERFEDVTRPRRWPNVELICGGFPCQDVSSAGKRRGLGGERSGLWYHFAKVVSQVRPRFVIVENVASGVRAWLPTVRRNLCELGYRTRAFALSAADVGAPHLRRRVFVVAHADGESEPSQPIDAEVGEPSEVAAHWRKPMPDMVRMVHGVSRGLDGRRVKALGNSVVPQCAEAIGRIVKEIAA